MDRKEKKRIYLKKITHVAGFQVWYVNGYWIRKNIDADFNNFGQHYRFKFIPKHEFWIDKENGESETKYYIEHLLIENKLMEAGQSYDDAIDKADLIEKAERGKDKFITKIEKEHKDKILKRIHKKLLKRLSDEVKVWIVHGNLVRSLYYIDFTQGGHDHVYDFVPRGEVWVDDDVYKKEMPFVILHELHERRLMMADKKSKSLKECYEKAHKKASEMEIFYRHHPKKIKRKLIFEIKKNKI